MTRICVKMFQSRDKSSKKRQKETEFPSQCAIRFKSASAHTVVRTHAAPTPERKAGSVSAFTFASIDGVRVLCPEERARSLAEEAREGKGGGIKAILFLTRVAVRILK